MDLLFWARKEKKRAKFEGIMNDIRSEFDPKFYLANNDDVRKANTDPLFHYVKYGWKEGRDPNENFSTSEYLESNQDVQRAGVNPFWHYIVAGRQENRSWNGRDKKVDTLKHLASIEVQERALQINDITEPTLGRDQLSDAFAEISDIGNLHIALSHDNYSAVPGGVQLCMKIEEQRFRDGGSGYLHLFPVNARLWLTRSSDSELLLGLNLNGAFLGTARAADVLFALGAATVRKSRLIVHSILGHSSDFIVKLNEVCAETPIYWNHDHSSICVSYNLQRNGVTCCDGPSLRSAQCRICVFGEERAHHLRRVEQIFNALNPIVVSPSAFAKEYWEKRSALRRSSSIVLEHCQFGEPCEFVPKDGPVRIAFIGTPASHKGWERFRELALTYAQDERYEFHSFGQRLDASFIQSHEVSVAKDGPLAMTDALASHDIDIGLLLSNWPETFCFTAFEAMSAGCFVVTTGASGNIACLVRDTGLGAVLNDEDLPAAFVSDDICRLVEKRRAHAKKFPLHYSRMTAGLTED